MAIARLSVKVGKAGKAAPHADYIAREGPYANRLERGETLEAKEAGNMPAWAADQPGRFWHAADAFERANGTTYRELELSLPRELTAADRAALVRAFVAQEIGERHPYQWAIHRPKAADGQDQPHAHLMFSERRQDGIERDPDQFFKRWNAKAPEKGGAHKRFGEVDGPNRSQAQRAADLRALRGRWGEMVNDHLERAGRDERIDMRSLKAQGIDRAPEKKQTPRAWRDPQQRGTVLEYRQIHKDRDQAAAEFRALVPEGRVVDLEAHAAKLAGIRAEIQAKAAADLEKLRAEQEANTARLEAKQAAEAAAQAQQRAAHQAEWLAGQPARDAAERDRLAQVEARNQAELERQREERDARFQAQLDAQAARLAALSIAPKAPEPAPPAATQMETQRGELIDHGAAPYRHWPEGVPSYFVSLRTADSKTHTYWSAGLETAIKDSGARVGDSVDLAQTGQVPAVVRDKDGTAQTVQRITWTVEIRARGQDPEAVYAVRLRPIKEEQEKAAAASIEALQTERQQWTQAHRDHQEAKPWHPMRAKWKAAGAALDATGQDLAQRERSAERAVDPRAIEAAAVAELRRVAPGVVAAAEAARREREAREEEARRAREAREQEARRIEQEKRRAEYARTRVADDFAKMAMGREYESFGYRDHSDKWKALPSELKTKIEDYNRLPKDQQPAALEQIGREPRTAELLTKAKEISREQGHGR